MNNANKKEFNKNMNVLRGIGVFLVVLGHASFKENFVKIVPNTTYLKWLVEFIYTFHMPLFFFISGFFAKKMFEIKSKKEYLSYIKRKSFRLLLPYFTFSILGLAIKLLMSNYANNPVNINTVFLDILINPWENPIKLLWFIYTLYFIYLLLPLLNKLNNKIKLIVLGVSWVIPISYGIIFNINGIIRYSLFVILGYEFYKKYNLYISRKKYVIKPILQFLFLILINIKPIQTGNLVNVFELVCSLLAISALLDFVHIIKLDGIFGKVFNYLGKYSYDIYLLHWFFQMPVRLVYEKLKFDYNILFFIALLAAFISIPVSKFIIKRVPLFNFLLFGNNNKDIK